MNAAETRLFLAALTAALSRGQGAAIASVVGVRGSAYRREGTRMLVLDDASQVCMLSGGCLEAEVVEVALEVIRTGVPQLTHYDLSEDASTETAMVFGELYRNGAEWKFRAVGQGYASGLAGIARDYGVNV